VPDLETFETLAELHIQSGDWAWEPLVVGMNSADMNTAAVAAGALYRRHVHDLAMRPGSDSGSVFARSIAPRLRAAPAPARLLAAIVCYSFSSVPTFLEPAAEREDSALRATIIDLMMELLGIPSSDLALESLLAGRDCVGLCAYAAEHFATTGEAVLEKAFLHAAVNGSVRLSASPGVRIQARLNRALALLRLGENERAAQQAAEVFEAATLEPQMRVQALALLRAAGAPVTAVTRALDEIVSFYVLDPERESAVTDLRRALERG
jgi:hypothetical protein